MLVNVAGSSQVISELFGTDLVLHVVLSVGAAKFGLANLFAVAQFLRSLKTVN